MKTARNRPKIQLEYVRDCPYDSSMSMTAYPLRLPRELLDEIKRTATETGLSMADAMRQAIRHGLPMMRRNLSTKEDFAEAAADSWERIGAAPTVNFDKL